MYDEIQKAFDQIHATEQMKQSVSDYLKQENQKTTKNSAKFRLVTLAPVFAVLLLCIGIGNWYFWEMPVSYVSVDVNPSIELTLNRRNRVTDAKSRNRDGAKVLEHLQLKGKDYLEAVELLVESDAMQPYLTADAELTVTVASVKAEELLSGLQDSVVATHYHGMCGSADMETVTAAHDCGMSLGKYQIYQLLTQYGSGLTAENCQNISMCQLQQLLSQYENGRSETVSENELENMQAGCSHGRQQHHHHSGHHDEQ
ncbi:hypothetical protein E5329_14155 [Petralouisia muris]|jgi:hypothetical protein|uniref:Uncharacterized protein n=1 Tax=Petralouisia muris TaxID=3032872 RepID=A0AC61RUK8_9FIRM|nr:hypothetical protein [Petralouisia muris]TGY95561.1 hypothetical protein E5329_14155 [Petralouisia muris]